MLQPCACRRGLIIVPLRNQSYHVSIVATSIASGKSGTCSAALAAASAISFNWCYRMRRACGMVCRLHLSSFVELMFAAFCVVCRRFAHTGLCGCTAARTFKSWLGAVSATAAKRFGRTGAYPVHLCSFVRRLCQWNGWEIGLGGRGFHNGKNITHHRHN